MNLRWETPIKALEVWSPKVKAAKAESNEIYIYEEIGEGLYTSGVTASFVSDKLSLLNGDDVILNINSPGGDMFEGLAIYNVLKEYNGNVKVRIMGLAASAASIIAMAGDNIEIAESGFIMIHNAWSLAVGNKYDFEKAAKDFAKFDAAMAAIYKNRTGMASDEIIKMMDEETFISGDDAISMGFADNLLGDVDLEQQEGDTGASALRQVDVALAKAGMPRTERRELIKSLTSTPSAADATPSASDESVVEALKALQQKINSLANGV